MMQHHRIRLSTGNCLMSSLVDVEGMSNSGTFLSSTFNPLSLSLTHSPPQVWFQNQRAKVKKIQKKQMKEGAKPKDESQEESENESKMSVKIKDENSSE